MRRRRKSARCQICGEKTRDFIKIGFREVKICGLCRKALGIEFNNLFYYAWRGVYMPRRCYLARHPETGELKKASWEEIVNHELIIDSMR
ncbi:MAG: hypothetical protein DRO36_05630 [Candidatus Hecatellales archaeon]|nr:MAG: hypothetical protein DRO36_05630 [Candidatus Hecatellales archaeon]